MILGVMKRSLILPVVVLAFACTKETPAPPPATSTQATAKPPLTFVRDPHSYANPAEVRVEHLALDLKVDFAKKQLSGTAALRIEKQADAKTLILDTAGLDIHSVKLQPGDASAPFVLDPEEPILGRKLEIPISADTTGVTIDYTTHPDARALQWLEPAMTAGKKHPFLLSQSQAINARTWVPLQDTPQVRFTYEATLHVPKELMAVMSAENPTTRGADGVYHFKMPQPIPSYLLAIAVGDLVYRSYDNESGVFAEPATIDAAVHEFSDTPKMIAAAEELYGPYHWGKYDLLVLPPSFPYGGMENPRLTFLTPTVIAGDRSLVSLIAHELAHSWSGNLVTNATWNDFWINEGFTTYFEHRISEKLYGREYSEMLWQLGLTDLKEELATLPPKDQGLYIELAGRNPDDAPGIVYEKGALFLRLLEETAGRDRWDKFLRTYFDTFTFQSMTTKRLVEYLKTGLPDVVKRVNVDEWVYGSGIPANAPKPKSEAFARVEADAKRFAEGAPASSIDMSKWSSHERVHFIQSLPNLYPEHLASLDTQFHFSESGNSEVLSAWLEKALDSGYTGVYPAVERFLTTQGRRKFLKPLYERLAKSDPAFARKIYAKARPSYHPVSQSTIDEILK
jgi:aminopeptidase N